MAYFLAFRVTRYKAMWIILLTIPFWTSYLLRVFSWKIMLGFNGAINSGLIAVGLIDKPLDFLLYNPLAVMITLTHSWIAFAVLPIYVSLEKIDRSLLEAASDLGDSRWRRFRRITLPLSMPGTIAATLLVFIPTVGDYVTPTLVGGPGGTMIGIPRAASLHQAGRCPAGGRRLDRDDAADRASGRRSSCGRSTMPGSAEGSTDEAPDSTCCRSMRCSSWCSCTVPCC